MGVDGANKDGYWLEVEVDEAVEGGYLGGHCVVGGCVGVQCSVIGIVVCTAKAVKIVMLNDDIECTYGHSRQGAVPSACDDGESTQRRGLECARNSQRRRLLAGGRDSAARARFRRRVAIPMVSGALHSIAEAQRPGFSRLRTAGIGGCSRGANVANAMSGCFFLRLGFGPASVTAIRHHPRLSLNHPRVVLCFRPDAPTQSRSLFFTAQTNHTLS